MKVGIILGTNEISGLMFASIEAGMRASMGDEVTIFVTMDGLLAFRKEPETKSTTETSRKIVEKGEDFRDYMKDAKESGFLKIYVCYYAAEIYKVKASDMNDLVDDFWGITKFSIESEDSQVISIW